MRKMKDSSTLLGFAFEERLVVIPQLRILRWDDEYGDSLILVGAGARLISATYGEPVSKNKQERYVCMHVYG